MGVARGNSGLTLPLIWHSPSGGSKLRVDSEFAGLSLHDEEHSEVNDRMETLTISNVDPWISLTLFLQLPNIWIQIATLTATWGYTLNRVKREGQAAVAVGSSNFNTGFTPEVHPAFRI